MIGGILYTIYQHCCRCFHYTW